jgi:hypothetical protein
LTSCVLPCSHDNAQEGRAPSYSCALSACKTARVPIQASMQPRQERLGRGSPARVPAHHSRPAHKHDGLPQRQHHVQEVAQRHGLGCGHKHLRGQPAARLSGTRTSSATATPGGQGTWGRCRGSCAPKTESKKASKKERKWSRAPPTCDMGTEPSYSTGCTRSALQGVAQTGVA